MKLVEVADITELGRRAMEVIVAQLHSKPGSLLTLPTGNTPLAMFRELVLAHKREPKLFEQARFVTLDEYAGIAKNDRRRLLSWLRRELFDPVGLGPDQVIAFDPAAEAIDDCLRIENAIVSCGGLDLAVLGLGPNGHLGFNEPGSAFESRARQVELSRESLISNAAYWGSIDNVPRYGLTLGLATIMAARAALLLVSGARKAHILARALHDEISIDLPATILRCHGCATVLADSAALAGGASRASHPG